MRVGIDISAGRFTLGIGAGGGGTGGYDATVLGRDELSTKQTSDRFDEFVSLTDLLLRQDRTSWDRVSTIARSTPATRPAACSVRGCRS